MAHRGGFEPSKLAILPTYHTHGRDKHAHGRAHVPLFGLSINKKVDRKVDKIHTHPTSICI